METDRGARLRVKVARCLQKRCRSNDDSWCTDLRNSRPKARKPVVFLDDLSIRGEKKACKANAEALFGLVWFLPGWRLAEACQKLVAAYSSLVAEHCGASFLVSS